MTNEGRAHVRRFLDVTKAALFFARGIVFVEGVSEQLLLPHLARGRPQPRRQRRDHHQHRGVAFSHFAALFAKGGLPIPCSIISDGDADPTFPSVDEPRLQHQQRGENLLALHGGNVGVFLADVTLEWDLARAQPRAELLTAAMTRVHPRSGPRIAAMTELSPTAWATEFRDKLAEGRLRPGTRGHARCRAEEQAVVPDYLKRAIAHATTPPPASPERESSRLRAAREHAPGYASAHRRPRPRAGTRREPTGHEPGAGARGQAPRRLLSIGVPGSRQDPHCRPAPCLPPTFHPDVSVAAVSHTNTAIDAIHAAAQHLTSLPEHYWMGTLHAFLLRYVVYPFGHLYMGCTGVPQVAGDERDWPDDIPDVGAHGDYPGCRVKA